MYNTCGVRGVGELIIQGVIERQQTLPSVVKGWNCVQLSIHVSITNIGVARIPKRKL